MNTLQIGPLAVAADRLLAIAALWAFVAIVSYSRRWVDGEPSRPAFMAVALGILAARAGFVVENWPAFEIEPWTAAYVWQGGFSPLFGLGAAAATLIVMLRGKARVVAMAALLVVGAAWYVADRLIEPPAKPLPAALLAEQLDGASVALDSFRGQPFVINLWATWCGPCQREMPLLVEVARANRDVPVLIINQGEDAQRVSRYLTGEGLQTKNILLDPSASVGSALRSSALPTTAFVSADGTVIDVHIGEISRAALIGGVRELRPPAFD